MFQPKPLPRTLSAALRDSVDKKEKVRRGALADLVRHAGGSERKSAVAGLVAVLRDDENANVRADAALALADAEARGALPELLRALDDIHERVRQMAILALGELSPRGHKEATEAIGAALDSDWPALRFQALIAARRIRIEGLQERLGAALNDAERKVRYIALRLIEEHWQEFPAVPASLQLGVRQCLDDEAFDVQIAASILLARSEPRARELIAQAVNRGWRLAAPEDEQALIELCGELNIADSVPGLKRQAWGRLGLVPGRFAWQAKVSLARLKEPRAVQEILRGLGAWSRDTRSLAVAAAGRARLLEARPIIETLASEDRAEASAVSEALQLLKTEE